MVGLFPIWLTGLIPLWPSRRQADGESVHRASDSPPATVQDMGVNHSGRYIGMPEQLLNRPDVVAILEYSDVAGTPIICLKIAYLTVYRPWPFRFSSSTSSFTSWDRLMSATKRASAVSTTTIPRTPRSATRRSGE